MGLKAGHVSTQIVTCAVTATRTVVTETTRINQRHLVTFLPVAGPSGQGGSNEYSQFQSRGDRPGAPSGDNKMDFRGRGGPPGDNKMDFRGRGAPSGDSKTEFRGRGKDGLPGSARASG